MNYYISITVKCHDLYTNFISYLDTALSSRAYTIYIYSCLAFFVLCSDGKRFSFAAAPPIGSPFRLFQLLTTCLEQMPAGMSYKNY